MTAAARWPARREPANSQFFCHRRFVSMQYAVAEQLLPQGIDQRLQLHAALADPGTQHLGQ